MGKRFARITKISWKLTVVYSLLFSCVLLLLSGCVLFGVRYYTVNQAKEEIRSVAAETKSLILDPDDGKISLFNPDLLSESETDSDVSMTIFDARGTVVQQAGFVKALQEDVHTHLNAPRQIEMDDMHLVLLNTEVLDGTGLVGYLQIVLNTDKSQRFLSVLFWLLVAADVIGILASVAAGHFISLRMLRPIDKITRTAQRIRIENLDSRIPVGEADDEIARLATTINSMLDRLQDSIEKQTQFVSDASHELRTPVSVVLGYVGLLDRWGKDDPKVLQESVDAIKNETLAMRELIEKLLFLARNDSRKLPLSRMVFDMRELIKELAEESKMLDPDKNITCHCEGAMMLEGDRNLIKQMLRNLIDNSMKFTKADGTIALHATAADGRVMLIVEDDGTGMPADEVEHVFDRFYRVDKARSKETGGSGLGLAIVKSIVDLHGGHISMRSAPGEGTCVTIELPACPAW